MVEILARRAECGKKTLELVSTGIAQLESAATASESRRCRQPQEVAGRPGRAPPG
jgi:hypothetical protein